MWIPRLPPISSDRLDYRWKKNKRDITVRVPRSRPGGGALVTGRHSRFNATKGRVGCDLLVSFGTRVFAFALRCDFDGIDGGLDGKPFLPSACSSFYRK